MIFVCPSKYSDGYYGLYSFSISIIFFWYTLPFSTSPFGEKLIALISLGFSSYGLEYSIFSSKYSPKYLIAFPLGNITFPEPIGIYK